MKKPKKKDSGVLTRHMSVKESAWWEKALKTIPVSKQKGKK